MMASHIGAPALWIAIALIAPTIAKSPCAKLTIPVTL